MKSIDIQLNAARIAKINQSVTNNSTLSPYMLFPLRLETHFREAQVSSRPDYEIEKEDVLRGFGEIIKRFYELLLPGVLRAGSYSTTMEEALYDLKTKVDELDLLSPEDKMIMVYVSSMLNVTVSPLLKKVGYPHLMKYLKQINEACEEIEVSSAIKDNPATAFIRELKANYKALSTLGQYTKTPYRSKEYYRSDAHKKEENERLYRYVTGRVITIANFFESALQRFKNLPSMDNRQRQTAIFKLHATDFDGAWFSLFDDIYLNMRNLYSGFDHQSKQLMKQYDKHWSRSLDDARVNCDRFIRYFESNINKKPRTSSPYIRLVQSILHLDISLLEALFKKKHIPSTILIDKIRKADKLASKTAIVSRTEKSLLLTMISDLKLKTDTYCGLMEKEGYTSYQKISNYHFIKKGIDPYHISEQTGIAEKITTQKQLCVRIFPDELFVHQHDKLLTKEEALDGKIFWIKWFIASGNFIYEKEAWNVLWRKYDVMRASWIVRTLYPKGLPSFSNMKAKMEDPKSVVYKRPYKNNVEMELALEKLVETSNKYDLSERDNQAANEGKVIACVKELLPEFYKVRKILMQYDKIVDYLFKRINADINYVKRKLEQFIDFYDRFPHYKVRADMAYRDIDNLALMSFYDELRDLLFHIHEQEISLDAMVNEYLERLNRNDVFFPKIDTFRDDDDVAPPISAIMPDRFLFFGDTVLEVKGKEVMKRIVHAGRKVKSNLALSIDLDENEEVNPYDVDLETGDMNIRGGIRWMTDYDTAVKSGMAITVPLPHDDDAFKKAKFSSIYVFGVKDKKGNEVLEDFFNGHIYGQSGLDFLKIGTPTNSFDDIESGYNTDEELLEERRYEIDVEKRFINSNVDLQKSMLYAIGSGELFNDTLGRVNSFDNNEIAKAKLINKEMTTVFSSSFSKVRNGTKATCKTGLFLEQIPKFVKNYSFARGFFPPMRIGTQPYGIMATTAFSRFEFEMDADTHIKHQHSDFILFAKQLHQLLKRITDIWTTIRRKHVISSENLIAKGDPQRRYLEMMGQTPVSVSFFERTMIEAAPLLHPSLNYHSLNKKDIDIAKILKDIFKVDVPAGQPNSIILDELGLFKAHAIAGAVTELKNELTGKPDLAPFISTIFDADKLNQLKGMVPENEIPMLIAEFMDLFTYRLDAWWLGLVNFQLHRIRNTDDFGRKGKDTSIGAYGWLFNLERRQKGRLLTDRESKAVHNEMKLSDKSTPIFKDDNNNEFILAPSISHAITAAVLRSSYNNSKKSATDSRLCINLSSSRVRQALRMIDGIRNGLSIGTVLGADLERNMHEAYKIYGQEMDRYIYPLRKMFPMKIDIKSEQVGPEANSYAMSVINVDLLLGSALKSYEDQLGISISNFLLNSNQSELKWFVDLFSGRNPKHKEVMALLIEQIADTYDALTDLIVSEGVYQLVQGNRVAFSALMNSMRDGKVFTNPEISEIPMHSAVVRHKVGVALDTSGTVDVPGWNRDIVTENTENETVIESLAWVMAETEPAINHWIGTMLGNSKSISFGVVYVDDSNKKQEINCTLSDLGVSPLEYFYLSLNESILSLYLELKYRRKHNIYSGTIEINQKTSSSDMGMRSLFETRWMTENIRSIVSSSRAMNAEDLSTTAEQTDEENQKGVNVTELQSRYTKLLAYCERLNREFTQLNTTYQNFAKANPNSIFINEDNKRRITELLIESASIGVTESLTTLAPDFFSQKSTAEDMIQQQKNLLAAVDLNAKRLSAKTAEAKGIIASIESNDTDERVSAYTKAIQTLTMSAFKIVPLYNLNPLADDDKEALSLQLKDNFVYHNASALEMETWAGEVSKVREPMGHLYQVRILADITGVKQESPAVLQFPYDPDKDNEWLGREVTSEDLVDDKDSVVLYGSDNFSKDIRQPKAGLMIDQWMELIPYEHQNGGVAFKYDQPDAEAPQVILLAVPAKITMRKRGYNRYEAKNWALSELIATLNDTRALAQNRAVEPDHLYAESGIAKIVPLLKYKKKAIE